MVVRHAGAVLTVHSDGAGSVWVTAAWVDGHPVTGPAAALLTATAAGQLVGPAPLRAFGDGAGTLAYAGQLPPGRWTVTAELASPAVARCEARIDVGTPARATAVTCAEPAAAPPGADGPPVGWLAAALAAALLAAVPLARWGPRRRR